MEEINNAKKSYEEKKEEKAKKREENLKQQKQKSSTRSLIRWIFFLVVLALLGWGGYSLVQDELPQGEDLSVSFPELGRQHIPFEAPFEYNSNPPSSGDHYERPAQTGFYDVTDTPIPDNVIVHNLEHGDIWITYRPDISDDIKEILRGLVAPKVIVTPRVDNDTDIAVVAWTRVDAFNIDETEDIEQRIKDFITRYINLGPEKIPATSAG